MLKPLVAALAAMAMAALAPTKAATADHAPAPLELLNPDDITSADEYPPTSRKAGSEGKVAVKLIATASGALADCRIVKSSGDPSLDNQTCDALRRRGKFRVSGAPNEPDGRYSLATSLRWTIAARSPRPLFLGVVLESSQPFRDNRIRCRFSDGVITFVPVGQTCSVEVPQTSAVIGGRAQSLNIIDYYAYLDHQAHKSAYDFNIAVILAAYDYDDKAILFLTRASDEGVGPASLALCKLYAGASPQDRDRFDSRQAVQRCLMAREQGVAQVVPFLAAFVADHPDAATAAEKTSIADLAATFAPATPSVLKTPGHDLIPTYPKDALREEVQGRTMAVYHVTPSGRVDECLIAESSLSFALDDMVCRRLGAVGDFTPAMAAGQPVADWNDLHVNWVLHGQTGVPGLILGAVLGAALRGL